MIVGRLLAAAALVLAAAGPVLADPVTDWNHEKARQQGLQQLHEDAIRDSKRVFVPTQKDFQRIQDYNNRQLWQMTHTVSGVPRVPGHPAVAPVRGHRHARGGWAWTALGALALAGGAWWWLRGRR